MRRAERIGTVSNGFNGCEPVESINTNGVRSTFDVVRLSGSASQIEVAMIASIRSSRGGFSVQVGYRKASNKTIPFTDYTPPSWLVVNIITPVSSFDFNKKSIFEVYQYSDTKFRYARNGIDVLEFDFGVTGAYISGFNIHVKLDGGSKLPLINFYPALQYKVADVYTNAVSGKNLYGGATVGFEGKIQNPTLRDCEVNASTTIPKTDYGVVLW